MNKRKQLIIGGLAVLLCLLGIGGWHMLEKQHLQERMMEEVKSAEVKRVIEKRIKYIDKNAFTENGIIRSYEIDKTSIRQNPMGGIMVTIYVNHDKELDITYTIHKDQDGSYYSSGTYSEKLKQLLGDIHE